MWACVPTSVCFTSVCLSVCKRVYVCVTVVLCGCLRVCRGVFWFICDCVCFSMCVSMYMCVCSRSVCVLSMCEYVGLSDCVCVCVGVGVLGRVQGSLPAYVAALTVLRSVL